MAGKNRSTSRTCLIDGDSFDQAMLQFGRARAIVSLIYSEVSNGDAEINHVTLENALAQLEENLAATEALLFKAMELARARVAA